MTESRFVMRLLPGSMNPSNLLPNLMPSLLILHATAFMQHLKSPNM